MPTAVRSFSVTLSMSLQRTPARPRTSGTRPSPATAHPSLVRSRTRSRCVDAAGSRGASMRWRSHPSPKACSNAGHPSPRSRRSWHGTCWSPPPCQRTALRRQQSVLMKTSCPPCAGPSTPRCWCDRDAGGPRCTARPTGCHQRTGPHRHGPGRPPRILRTTPRWVASTPGRRAVTGIPMREAARPPRSTPAPWRSPRRKAGRPQGASRARRRPAGSARSAASSHQDRPA